MGSRYSLDEDYGILRYAGEESPKRRGNRTFREEVKKGTDSGVDPESKVLGRGSSEGTSGPVRTCVKGQNKGTIVNSRL